MLLRVGAYDAPDFDALYDGARALRWEDFIPREGAFPVRCLLWLHYTRENDIWQMIFLLGEDFVGEKSAPFCVDVSQGLFDPFKP